MPRKVKPPGMEKWTWEEIRAGHKFSKQGKRIRKLAKHLGATEGENGKIIPPSTAESPAYYPVMVGLMIFCFIILIFFPKGCSH
jgi:hypothetical protein